ncbi:cadherin-like domain-containing protein, partial [Vibrio splendidus]
VDEDGSLTDNVLTGTSSVDGDVTVKGFTVDGDDTEYSPGDTATITGVGTLELNENGSYTFTPVADYNGDVPVVTYTVTDGSGTDDTSTLKIEINAKD